MKMPMRTGLKIAIAVAATLALVVPAAQAGAHTADLSATLSAAKKKQRARHPGAVESGGQIACTRFGCQRIPANCHPEIEYDFDGLPTGFNIIVCTGGRR
jgi:hypothetical protein